MWTIENVQMTNPGKLKVRKRLSSHVPSCAWFLGGVACAAHAVDGICIKVIWGISQSSMMCVVGPGGPFLF